MRRLFAKDGFHVLDGVGDNGAGRNSPLGALGGRPIPRSKTNFPNPPLIYCFGPYAGVPGVRLAPTFLLSKVSYETDFHHRH